MIRFLTPGDVSPSRARTVLDFLNGASSAREIAEATDIPGVSDIGIRIAERILQVRDRLGGFTDLEQVNDVPLIGPVRFTWLVVSLSGPYHHRPRHAGELPPGFAREFAQLSARVEALLATSGASRSMSLRARQSRPYLGEPVDLVGELTGADGAPLIGIPITLVATWGTLHARDGAREMEGTSVTTRTDANGRARATLRPPTSERLGEVQQGSLADALALLERNAGSPREAIESLQELGRRYYAPTGAALRQAMDVYFRDFGENLADAIVPRDHLGAWAEIECTVLAHARDRRQGVATSSVHGTAALTLQIRNWLGPWLQVMSDVTRSQSRLDIDLGLAARQQEEQLVLGTVYKRLRDFVVDQPGLAAEFVARRVADDALERFAREGIVDLPVATQRSLAPALTLAARTVRSSGATVLAAAGQTRAEMTREVGSAVERRVGELLPPDLGELPAQLSGLRADLAALQGNLRSQKAALTTFQQQVSSELATTVRREAFDSYRAEVARELDLRVRVDALEELRLELAGQFELFVDAGSFDDFRSDITRTLDDKVDAAALQQLDARVTSQLSGKADAAIVDQLNRAVDEVRTSTRQVNTTIASLDQSVRQLDVQVRDIRRPR